MRILRKVLKIRIDMDFDKSHADTSETKATQHNNKNNTNRSLP